MKLGLALLTSILMQTWIFVSHSFAAGTCIVKRQMILPNLPKLRYQAGGGTCYAQAIATAVDFKTCQTDRVADCSKSENSVSVPDLIKQTFGDQRFEYESSWDILKTLNSLHKIARDRCAPYSNLTNGQQTYVESDNFFGDLRAGSQRLKNGGELTTQQCNGMSLLSINTGQPFERLRVTLIKKSFSAFINSISVPVNCSQDSVAVRVKAEAVSPKAIDLSDAGLEKILGARLRENIPVVWRFCAGFSSNGPCPPGNAHFATIIGERTNCCGIRVELCEKQYLVRDSGTWASTYAENVNKPGDYWLSANTVSQRTAPALASDLAEGYAVGSFMWIQ
jgi:hypothetical protein